MVSDFLGHRAGMHTKYTPSDVNVRSRCPQVVPEIQSRLHKEVAQMLISPPQFELIVSLVSSLWLAE